jgi:hypothetical protein
MLVAGVQTCFGSVRPSVGELDRLTTSTVQSLAYIQLSFLRVHSHNICRRFGNDKSNADVVEFDASRAKFSLLGGLERRLPKTPEEKTWDKAKVMPLLVKHRHTGLSDGNTKATSESEQTRLEQLGLGCITQGKRRNLSTRK